MTSHQSHQNHPSIESPIRSLREFLAANVSMSVFDNEPKKAAQFEEWLRLVDLLVGCQQQLMSEDDRSVTIDDAVVLDKIALTLGTAFMWDEHHLNRVARLVAEVRPDPDGCEGDDYVTEFIAERDFDPRSQPDFVEHLELDQPSRSTTPTS